MTKEDLGELIIASTDTMYRISKTILLQDDDCHDAISETIIKAYSKIHTLRHDEYAKSWLIRILINECYNIIKKNKRIVSICDYEEILVSKPETDYTDLYQAIISLPEKLRITIVLYYFEGYSVKEVAMMLKTTESAIKKRLFRARQELKICLEEEGIYAYHAQ